MQGERAILLDHRLPQVRVSRNHAAGTVDLGNDPAESRFLALYPRFGTRPTAPESARQH
ncbi:hypothetical protein [Arthrobacter methylotrophus]|uniref:hypothetical protein n=1 Tax=Arthrobacter methylotrophus TaxID=121291 RepID=UPI0031EBC714